MDRVVRCQLAAHGAEPNHGFLDDLGTYGTALWLRWDGAGEVGLATLPDCAAVAPGSDPDACCLFAGHAGGHTWESLDPRRKATGT